MTVSVRMLGHGEEARWDDYVSGFDGASLYHHSGWRSFYEDVVGHRTYYMVAEESAGNIVGILPLVRLKSMIFGDYMVSVPFFNYGGVVADSNEARQSLLDAASELALREGVSHVEYRDTQSLEGVDFQRRDKVAMLLELPETGEALLSGMKAKRRSQIKRPVREGAEAQVGGVELLDDFYRVFSINMRDLGTPVYSKSFFRGVLQTSSESSFVVVVRVKGKPAAAGILLKHRDTMEVPWASSLREYNNIGANMFLYWNLLDTAIKQGCRFFDFGRSTRDGGTYRFKKQWGAQEKQLYWHYWLRDKEKVPNLTPTSGKFGLAIRLWKILPVFVANAFGPFLVRNLP